MGFDLSNAWDSIKDGISETAEVAHTKTNEFHEKYVSKVTPDFGKYGDAAKFAAEMVPGVSEYNAIKDGDWQAFAIAAGIDIAAVAIGAFTTGAGYAAVKGGTSVAKAGVKVAVKEVAEAGEKKVVKETVEAGAKKVVKETVEAGVEKAVKETVEAGAEKAVKETAEVGVEKVAKETVEAGTEKVAKEVAEESTEKTMKEVAEKGTESLDEIESQITKNKLDGTAREEKVLDDLISKNGEDNVIREALLRDKDGVPIKDPETGEARRIDFIVTQGKKIIESIEVTSETADKTLQMAKQTRILEEAVERGGAFIKDKSGDLIEFTVDIITEIRRLP